MATDNWSATPTHAWFYLVRRFSRLVSNLELTPLQLGDGWTKQGGVRTVLNRHYWGLQSDAASNGFLSGSWGKGLQVRPPRDVDLLFFLPWTTYQQYEQRVGNRQSQLLQEVRSVLGQTYGETTLRGDGQVVVVRFATTPVEVIPAFPLNNGTYLICDTRDGGRYIQAAPHHEIQALDASDTANAGATRRLIRIAKQWQRQCDVPIKSFQLERVAIEFLGWWGYSRDLFWVDWMVRDFFAYLASCADGIVTMPGTNTTAPLGGAWASKARTAHATASRACDYEQANENVLAGYEWQSLFGAMCPLTVE